jgi:ABC-type lipoprotein export system ATPase subunit
VSKVYGQGTAEVHALDDVSLSVDDGSMVAVMGAERLGQVHATSFQTQLIR